MYLKETAKKIKRLWNGEKVEEGNGFRKIAEGVLGLMILGPKREWQCGDCFVEKVLRKGRRMGEAEDDEEKWIGKVTKRMEKKGTKGKFREWCEKRGYTKVTKGCIEEAKREARKTGNLKLLRRAIAAENMMRAAGIIK